MKTSGILLHIAGLWLLSALDASGKWLVMAGVSVLMVAWMRYAVHTALMTAVVLPSRGRAIFQTRSLPRQLVRGLLMITTTVLFFSVLGRLPLAEATAINFMAPLFLMMMAPWLLHEAHRLHRWLGVLAGFAGMLIVVRPGAQLDPVGVALGLATALAFAFFQIATRRVAHDDPLTTNYYGGLIGTIALTLALPWFWHTPDLSPWQWLLLVSTGVTGFLGHWLQIAAFRQSPATLLAPFSYLQIVAAATLGWLVFGQAPGRTTALGIALICLAGLGVALTEARLAWVRSRALREGG
ncbi:MAG: DMT family transporter [Polaromonas sp.]|uniref:DMT family transporter n=1 Tax=Polaromonas sp. TaxID=1869339 RepID=UPI0024895850|nr:DMT family transporter [Polaromonas sp.]MDI1238312.1 DMT family transporter [Polaromonas sp.]MDI1341789.1 DMT family transporter [Polaromonas sp.]